MGPAIPNYLLQSGTSASGGRSGRDVITIVSDIKISQDEQSPTIASTLSEPAVHLATRKARPVLCSGCVHSVCHNPPLKYCITEYADGWHWAGRGLPSTYFMNLRLTL